ncbi:MAG: glycosyltransferase [Bacteroidales bacterium]|nr:glycosyltransferase [Bacteroidales bacterium]
MKRVILSVTEDLYTDQRMDKMSLFLHKKGFDVTLVGRCYGDSPVLEKRPYKTKRLRLLFRKGSIFYAEYTVRLLFYLLFKKCDLLVANDLDTLLPNYLVSKWRKKPLVYDSHEYFCGELSVVSKPISYKVWHGIEKFCFPKLKTVITVSQSIVDQYEKEYGIRPYLVRNIPPAATPLVTATRQSLQMPDDKTVLLLQGSGINEGRGGEEIVQAMQYLPDCHLFIVGNGTVLPQLKKMSAEMHLQDRITFVPRQTPENLFNYTSLADMGMAIDTDQSANLRFSLPNKIFDYIKAGLPMVVSNLVERARIVKQYKVGTIAESVTPEALAAAVKELSDPELLAQCRENCKTAARELTWENEEKVLEQVYAPYL